MEQAHVESRLHHDYRLQRLIVLTDAVFAIAMTLLALELRPPANWGGSVVGLFSAMRLSILAYVVSFFVVASYWSSHRRSFGFVLKADGPLTLLSLLALGLVTLLPVVTRLMIEHGGDSGALAVYLGLFAAIGVINAVVWGYACVRPGLLDPSLDSRFRWTHLAVQVLPALFCCAVIGLNSTGGSIWRWFLILLLFIATFAFRRWMGRAPKPRAPKVEAPPPA